MTSTAAAQNKARKSEVTHYKMYIDGKFVDAKGGKTFDVYDPVHRGRDRHLSRGRRRGRGPGGQGGAPRLLRRMARRERAGARPDPLPPRRAHQGAPRRAGGSRDGQFGQADRRVRVRHGRYGHLLRVLRRPRHQDQRRSPSGPRRRRRLCHARADRGGRADHPLELSAAHGGLENRARARRRLHGGHQAGRADAAESAQARRGFRGGRAAAGGGERRHRRRSRRGRSRSSPTPTSGRSPSPAARRSASSSCATPPTSSSGSRSSSAASRPISSSPMPTSRTRSTAPSSAPSSTRARSAPRGAECWCRRTSTGNSWTPRRQRRRRSSSAAASTGTRRWGRS